LTKNGLGYLLGDFFTNSSGHPGRKIAAHFSMKNADKIFEHAQQFFSFEPRRRILRSLTLGNLNQTEVTYQMSPTLKIKNSIKN
jgi:hypothetical protein